MSRQDAAGRFFSKGELIWQPEVWNRWLDRTQLWTANPKRPIEIGAVLIGEKQEVESKKRMVVTDFVELPVYNLLNRDQGLSINIDDILCICERKTAIGFIHTHPNSSLLPSMADWQTFTYIEGMRNRDSPFIYIIMSPDGKCRLYDFESCLMSDRSFLDLFRSDDKPDDKSGAHGGHAR